MDTLAVENDKCLYVLQRDAATTPATWRVVFQQVFWPSDSIGESASEVGVD
jgi:hypothetical protein